MENEKKSKRIWYIGLGAGIIVLILVIILISIVTRDDETIASEITVPSGEFMYDSEENYGETLGLSTELEKVLFDGFSRRAQDEIMKRISAWFAIIYPEYETFALVKDSYKKVETEVKAEIEAKLVSNLGTIVGIEMIDEIKDFITVKTTVRILTLSGDEAYKTDIIWEELDV